ncbi:uncharacterized protein FIBRA_07903 [Fibroporia radiculosa]|uniref:Uncharacterized protein n=1 Tax=Fibroporia radiculosa TaxID=599839 RepID=J4GFV8_9APHY|nr:uncharacterized protein FIBRA_07903 [Fibroporia radiculosa]CCM05673.1 predicted protein [Fibroporia radiculosa]
MPLTDPRVRVQPPTPSTATSARSGTLPVTPTTPVPPPVTEVRRKRMAKLARTLGENIPLDLVFPPSPKSAAPPPPSAPPTAKTRRRRSASVDLGAVAPRSSRIWVTGDNSWIGEWNRRDIREVQQHLRVLKRR